MIITKNNALLEQKKTAGFILKPESPEIQNIYTQIKKVFQKNGIQVFLENADYRFDQLCQQSDFLVALGGDGTLISVARRAFHYQKAVMGINLGSLGFLTDIMPGEIDTFLKDFNKDQYRIDHRMMIEATLNDSKIVAFNDIVISRKSVTGMIKLDARVNNVLFNKYNGDGLIISTPTGSTAYNLSCNGPVVYPLTDAFIVTPISPHSLTQRPLVLPVDFKITLTNTDIVDAVAIIDGHDTYELKPNESLSIQIASSKAKLIHRLQRNYFDVLNKKLQWGAN